MEMVILADPAAGREATEVHLERELLGKAIMVVLVLVGLILAAAAAAGQTLLAQTVRQLTAEMAARGLHLP